MTNEIDTANPPQHKPKTKRVSSLLWIVVLWGCARAYAELHPIGWRLLFFWQAPIVVGAFPASAFLLLAVFSRSIWLEKAFRGMALISVCLSVSGVLAIGDKTAETVAKAQGVLFCVLLLCVLGCRMMTNRTPRE